MITCKICEKDTACDRLAEHSSKCIEVAKLREQLIRYRYLMEGHAEKASTMKNSLETYSVKQRRLRRKSYQRYHSSGESPATPDRIFLSSYHQYSSPASCGTKPKKTYFSGEKFTQDLSPDLSSDKQSESDTQETQDTKDTQDTQGTQENLETQEESFEGKLNEEDYEKFKDQVRKSTFVLKRIGSYADKINEWAFETASMNDLDLNFKHELEILYSEIDDTKVSEFLKSFMQDFCEYLGLKAQFIRRKEELTKIDSIEDMIPSFKPKLLKSMSYKQKNPAGPKYCHPKFKEDETFGSMLKEESPESTKSITSKKNPSTFSDQLTAQRSKFLPQRQTSANIAHLGKAASLHNLFSPKNTLGGLVQLLQTNSNHKAPVCVLNNTKKSTKEGLDRKESIKSSIKLIAKGFSFKILSEKETLEKEEKVELKENTHDSSPITPIPMEPRYIKHPLLVRKNILSEISGPISEVSEEKVVEKKTFQRSSTRHNSIGLFKAIHKEESLSKLDFPSLSVSGVDGEKKEGKCKLKPKTKQRSEEDVLLESPLVRGYHSDTNQRTKRKGSFGESNHQVSINDFEFIKFLGKGAYGTVWLVRKKATGDLYAMKIVDWSGRVTHNRLSALRAEKDIYEVLQGDFVVKAIWTFHYNNFICFVTEYMIGGDFNTFLEDAGRLDEDQARFYFAELVQAIESLHSLGIVHRDLKPENILMDNKGHIRLTDFGLSKSGLTRLRQNSTGTPTGRKSVPNSPDQQTENLYLHQRMQIFNQLCQQSEHPEAICNQKVKFQVKTTKKIFECLDYEGEEFHILDSKRRCLAYKKKSELGLSPITKKVDISPSKRRSNQKKVGTPDYMAPEVINPDIFGREVCDEKSLDWWSMGVILYQFLVGIPPFCGESIEEVFDNIENLRIEWPDIGYDEDCISPEAADLIKRLLHPTPSQRLGFHGVEEIKNHEFFKGKNFDWQDSKKWEPPIVPCIPEGLDINKQVTCQTSKDKVKDRLKLIFNEPPGRRIIKSKTEEAVDLGGFQMRRLDVLDKLNQEAFMRFQKQKSASGTLSDI